MIHLAMPGPQEEPPAAASSILVRTPPAEVSMFDFSSGESMVGL